MRTIKQILEAFKKDLRISFQAQRNVVDISERYIAELSDAEIGGGGGVDYSTEEQDTGLKWIDGSTIYQRTFVLRENSIDKYTKSNNVYTNVLPSDIKYIELVGMFALRSTGYADVQNISSEVNMVPDITNKGIYFASSHSHTNIILTFKYAI